MGLLVALVYVLAVAALIFFARQAQVLIEPIDWRWVLLGRSTSVPAVVAAFLLASASFIATGCLLRVCGFAGRWYTQPRDVLAFAVVVLVIVTLLTWLATSSRSHHATPLDLHRQHDSEPPDAA